MTRRLLASLLLVAGTPAIAEEPDAKLQRVEDIVAVLRSSGNPASVFTTTFLAAVPPAQLAELLRRLEGQYGRLLAAEGFHPNTPTSGRFTLRFERATAAATFAIEPALPNRVTGLRINSITPIGDNAGKVAADFVALPGRSGFAMVRLGEGGSVAPVAVANADEEFAIGSTFKLWVLDALAEEIAAGRHRWAEVVPLGPRSLPSGMTQDWPPGSPITVETLATLMISVSDNTATDTLIRLIGRERVAARVHALSHSVPSRMLPFLTTAESFALKLSPPIEREAYARADVSGRTRMLGRLDTAGLLRGDITALDAAPTAIDSIEWFASPRDVARVLDSLRRRPDPRILQILGVAPALPGELRDRFAYVGYKGGSETGVINLTWLLRAKSGVWTVVTASWNDTESPVDNMRFEQLAQRLVQLAAQGS